MVIEKQIVEKLTDNDEYYFKLLEVAIDHADPKSSVKVYKTNNKITVHLTPYSEDFRQDIIDNILSIHKTLNLVPHFSSSLKISKKISFFVNI